MHRVASDAKMPGCLTSCVLAKVAGPNSIFAEELDHRLPHWKCEYWKCK